MRAKLKGFGSRMSILEGNPEPGSETRGRRASAVHPGLAGQINGAIPKVLVQAQKLPNILSAPGSPEVTMGDHDAQ